MDGVTRNNDKITLYHSFCVNFEDWIKGFIIKS